MEHFFAWLVVLPAWSQILLVVALIACIFLITKSGYAVVTVGKTKIRLGSPNSKQRTCGDCALILFGKTSKYDADSRIILGKVLDDQMTYASNLCDNLFLSYLKRYYAKVNIDPTIEYSKKIKEQSLYKELISNAFDLVKKELRRSFKENGFQSFTEKELTDYIWQKTQDITSTLTGYLVTNYPQTDMIVSLNDSISIIEDKQLSEAVRNIYNEARTLKNTAEVKAEKLNQEFKTDIDKFIEGK
jgi:hypothetical protein